jgi:hypothetical protein
VTCQERDDVLMFSKWWGRNRKYVEAVVKININAKAPLRDQLTSSTRPTTNTHERAPASNTAAVIATECYSPCGGVAGIIGWHRTRVGTAQEPAGAVYRRVFSETEYNPDWLR